MSCRWCRHMVVKNFKMYCELHKKYVEPNYQCSHFEDARVDKKSIEQEYDEKLQKYKELKSKARELRLRIYRMVAEDDRDDDYIKDYIAPKIVDVKDGKVIMDFSSPIELRVERIRIPQGKEQEIMELWNRVQELEKELREVENWLVENRPIE